MREAKAQQLPRACTVRDPGLPSLATCVLSCMHRLRSHQSLTRTRLSPRDALVLMGGTDVDVEMPFAERAAALRGMHGFVCRCERCSVQREKSSGKWVGE